MTFGRLISTARRTIGLSQKQLAARIMKEDGRPISPQYLNDIEHDRRNPPSPLLIERLAKELQVSEDRLCAAAGSMPQDLKRQVAVAQPDDLARAFKAFRKA